MNPQNDNTPALLPGNPRAETLTWVLSDLTVLGVIVALWSVFIYLPFPGVSFLQPSIFIGGALFAIISIVLFIIIKSTALASRRKTAIIPAFYTASVIFNCMLTVLTGLAMIIMPTLAILNFRDMILQGDITMILAPFSIIFQSITAFIVAFLRFRHVLKARFTQHELR